MSISNDPGNFFQTEAALDDAERRKNKAQNESGLPLKLKSKILAVKADWLNPSVVFVAESAGTARRIDLDAPSDSDREYRGATAPLTSLALSTDGATLYAGCWDKSVWSWDVATARPGRRFAGHADFVKSVAVARVAAPAGGAVDLLVSGSADSTVGVWDAASGTKLHAVRGHVRGVLDVAVQAEAEAEAATAPTFTLWSAGSDRSILRHRVGVDSVQALPFPKGGPDAEVDEALVVHETSVNGLSVRSVVDESGVAQPVLLTASSDKLAKRIPASSTGDLWRPAQTLSHPDFVRAIVPLFADQDHALSSDYLLATACRDEEIRIWDAEDEGEAEPLFTLSGHFDEVSGLDVAVIKGEPVLVSVSLDGTLRRWPTTKIALDKMQREELERAKLSTQAAAGEASDTTKESLMTEDEERELAELMDEDD